MLNINSLRQPDSNSLLLILESRLLGRVCYLEMAYTFEFESHRVRCDTVALSYNQITVIIIVTIKIIIKIIDYPPMPVCS